MQRRQLCRGNLSLVCGGAIIGGIIAASLLAGLLSSYSPTTPNYDEIFADPSRTHPLGTDELGRDILARVLHGGRTSLVIAFSAVGLAAMVGIPIGLLIGFLGGPVDEITSRVVDALFAFPAILMALLILTVLGPSQWSLILALAVVSVAQVIRVTRSAVVSERANEYVAASRLLGSSRFYILFRSLLPNVAGPLIVMISIGCAYALLNAAALGFLGLGAAPPTPEWGIMLSEAREHLGQSGWYSVAPGACIFLSVLGFNLLGDGLQGLFDPRRERMGSVLSSNRG